MTYLVSSYTGLLWTAYSGIVQEVRWARDLVCVWKLGGVVHGVSTIICYV